MRLLVSVIGPDNMPIGSQVCEPGQPLEFTFQSPFLVSAGQDQSIRMSVFDVQQMVMAQMGPRDATHLRQEDGETPLIQVPVVWDVSFIPSRRTLSEILEDVVTHGQNNPEHGISCVCMDKAAREIRLQASKAIPPDGRVKDTDWAEPIQDRLNAKARIRYVLMMVERNL